MYCETKVIQKNLQIRCGKDEKKVMNMYIMYTHKHTYTHIYILLLTFTKEKKSSLNTFFSKAVMKPVMHLLLIASQN